MSVCVDDTAEWTVVDEATWVRGSGFVRVHMRFAMFRATAAFDLIHVQQISQNRKSRCELGVEFSCSYQLPRSQAE
jgi:hypothetical protein